MIEVRGLTKLYGSLVAVEDLSFSVAPGEVLGLVGPNGAGKTTTLRSLVGIVRPTRGTISIGGRDLDRDPVGAKRQLAFMPDEPRLFEYLTVEEHLRFTGRLYGVRGAQLPGPPPVIGERVAFEPQPAPGGPRAVAVRRITSEARKPNALTTTSTKAADTAIATAAEPSPAQRFSSSIPSDVLAKREPTSAPSTTTAELPSHQGSVTFDELAAHGAGDTTKLLAVKPRLKCTKCGARRADLQPDWSQRSAGSVARSAAGNV